LRANYSLSAAPILEGAMADPASRRRRRSGSRASATHGERRSALSQRLRFESFLLDLSADFARTPADRVAAQIDVWLRRLAIMIRVDRCTLWEIGPEGGEVRLLHAYATPGLRPPKQGGTTQQMSWVTEQYRRGNIIVWSRIPQDISPTALGERAWASSIGAKSALCIPMAAGPTTRSIVFVSVKGHRRWPSALIKRLRLVGEIFSSAIARHHAESSLQASESRNRALLEALTDMMFVMSPEGIFLDFHTRDRAGLYVPPEQFLGKRVDQVLPPELARRFLQAFARVSGTGANEEMRYCLTMAGERREYEAQLVRRDDGAIVSTVHDITERVKSHLEIERLRAELMRSERVASMGKLTASLAHELLQPIAAASANADACRKLLESGASKARLREILLDIGANCTRAASVIHRVRGRLTTEREPPQLLEINKLITEVAGVLHDDLARRQVHLLLKLDPSAPDIRGDRIELQQVILNLLVNGAEALSQRLPDERALTILTAHGSGEVELAVQDRGTGADAAHLRRMFEPFFTTKPGGIGLGLSICSDIVRSHGGRLWAENNAHGGMTVRCRLPQAEEASRATP
jgi:PAS domain S-box-containing protein